jgi:hypothetical protein
MSDQARERLDPAKQRAREALLADRAAVARSRVLRGVRVRPPASLPVIVANRRRVELRTGLGAA